MWRKPRATNVWQFIPFQRCNSSTRFCAASLLFSSLKIVLIQCCGTCYHLPLAQIQPQLYGHLHPSNEASLQLPLQHNAVARWLLSSASSWLSFLVPNYMKTNITFGVAMEFEVTLAFLCWECNGSFISFYFILLALCVGQRLCINFSVSRANFLTTLRSHLDVTCSCCFGSSLFNVDVNYDYICLVNYNYFGSY